MNQENNVQKITDLLLDGKIAPWKAEDVALKEGISTPDNMNTSIGN